MGNRRDVLTVLTGDCRATLKTLPAQSVQCVVTSPPYWGLRDYGHPDQIGLEPTPAAYVEALCSVFDEVARVLCPDGAMWVNLGDCYAAERGGTHMPAQTLAGGVGGKGDESAFRGMGGEDRKQPRRNASAIGLRHKSLVGIPWRFAFAMMDRGWILRADDIWAKTNPMPESVTDRTTRSHEYLFLLTRSPHYYYDADALREPHTAPGRPPGNKSKAFVDRTPRGAAERIGRPMLEQSYHPNGRNRRSVWFVHTGNQIKPEGVEHYAMMPDALARDLVLSLSRPGDTVLDPFGGTGTTGRVALGLGRRAVLCEVNPQYAQACNAPGTQIGLGVRHG